MKCANTLEDYLDLHIVYLIRLQMAFETKYGTHITEFPCTFLKIRLHQCNEVFKYARVFMVIISYFFAIRIIVEWYPSDK